MDTYFGNRVREHLIGSGDLIREQSRVTELFRFRTCVMIHPGAASGFGVSLYFSRVFGRLVLRSLVRLIRECVITVLVFFECWKDVGEAVYRGHFAPRGLKRLCERDYSNSGMLEAGQHEHELRDVQTETEIFLACRYLRTVIA